VARSTLARTARAPGPGSSPSERAATAVAPATSRRSLAATAQGPASLPLVLERASAGEVKKTAIAEGMLTLRRDGLEKLKRGITTVEEILKETAADNL